MINLGSTTIANHFAEEINRAVNPVSIFAGGKSTIDVEPLTHEETVAVQTAFRKGLYHIMKISPKLYASIAPQESAFVKWAQVVKATFPEEKAISYPAEAGTIGVDWLTPALYQYTGGNAGPDWVDYIDNVAAAVGMSWDITLVAGTAIYLAGDAADATHLYKSSSTASQHSFTVLAENGIIELNSLATPSINQIQVNSEGASLYSPFGVDPLISQPIEKGKNLYQYPTIGQIPLWYDYGTRIGVMPGRSSGAAGATIPLLGMTFFEYDFFSSLKT